MPSQNHQGGTAGPLVGRGLLPLTQGRIEGLSNDPPCFISHQISEAGEAGNSAGSAAPRPSTTQRGTRSDALNGGRAARPHISVHRHAAHSISKPAPGGAPRARADRRRAPRAPPREAGEAAAQQRRRREDADQVRRRPRLRGRRLLRGRRGASARAAARRADAFIRFWECDAAGLRRGPALALGWSVVVR